MSLYILDWSGTLDTLANPKGFVRALQYLGHKVVLYTGHLRLQHPASKAVDLYIVKGGQTFRQILLECLAEWPETKRILYSDNERSAALAEIEDLRTDWELEFPIEFLDPIDLKSHLSELAP